LDYKFKIDQLNAFLGIFEVIGIFLITDLKSNNKDFTMLRIRGQLIPRKKGCCLISFAPVVEPRRLVGSLCSSALINCLAARLA